MKISKVVVTNFRLLKDLCLILEDDLSLVIGKNNCGKTSLLSIMEKFLSDNSSPAQFDFDDFNIKSQKNLKKSILEKADLSKEDCIGIFLKIFIEYDEKDDLSNISSLMLDLDAENKMVVLNYGYQIRLEKLKKLKEDFQFYREKSSKEKSGKDDEASLGHFLKKNHRAYFEITKEALDIKNSSKSIDLITEKIPTTKIINFKKVSAKRDVSNDEMGAKRGGKTLSRMSSTYYDKISKSEKDSDNIIELQNKLSETDEKLNQAYKSVFSTVISKIERFGGVKKNESNLRIISSLEEKNILKDNTHVMYDHGDHSLPEDYNGLGYMNLIAMIFDIEIQLTEFKRIKNEGERPSDLNLLFIEEPEAHTHPQMQYVFIKNIKRILNEASQGEDKDGIKFGLQTIISTHSSHITSESDFDDIKYFVKESTDNVVAKNLKDLKNEYNKDDKQFAFLKKYLTINRAELFFADKAILIEGATERLLLPAIMLKMDSEEKDEDTMPLLSQNISIVEVGAYSHIFERLIDFLKIKTLIITDIDSCKAIKKINKKGNEINSFEKCPVNAGEFTSNASLKFFFNGLDVNSLKKNELKSKVFYKTKKEVEEKGGNKVIEEWISDFEKGYLCIVYQTLEVEYRARSFEDSFLSLNYDFVFKNKENFRSLKNIDDLDDANMDFYEKTQHCIGDNKTSFALDILYSSEGTEKPFENWKTPNYILEGLKWLKK